jgi:hypothetical protein
LNTRRAPVFQEHDLLGKPIPTFPDHARSGKIGVITKFPALSSQAGAPGKEPFSRTG